MEKIRYRPTGVCSTEIFFSVENGVVRGVEFRNGCPGNLQGIGRLIEGMPVGEAIGRLRGIDCRGKGTSCPDQLARALEAYASRAS